MADYLTDDEELETFKRWWKESGQQLLLVIVIAVSGYFGWQFWQDRQQHKAEAGFRTYQQLLESVQAENPGQSNAEQQQQLTHLAVKLKDEHSGSQYAHYASLLLARQAVENKDYELAASELNIVMENADKGLAAIARLRLAHVEAERSGPETALAVLDADIPEEFAASFDEARGDFYLLKGETESAREAYLRALSQLDDSAQQKRGILSLKLNQVAPATPAEAQEENS